VCGGNPKYLLDLTEVLQSTSVGRANMASRIRQYGGSLEKVIQYFNKW
jgi:hypothetical protein